jgi:hypothetical protein
MKRFWPVGEAAQGDYETLRAAVLAGTPPIGLLSARFERGGLAALIARPGSAAAFMAAVVGASRPPWTPYSDPRLEVLSDGYRLILGLAGGAADRAVSSPAAEEAGRR